MEPDKDGANARAAIYTRISKDLTLEGLGVARQLKDCRALAERKGWRIVKEFEDNDISAANGKRRPDYLRLKALMETGAVDVVVVYSSDRLHRNSRELEDWIDLASETGINIYSATNGHIDLSNPDGRTMARVATAFAAGEVEKTKMRLLRKHVELAEAGAWPGQKCYGYTADAQIVPEEAAVIREMADRVLHGEGLNAIARDLTARGISTARGPLGGPPASEIFSALRASPDCECTGAKLLPRASGTALSRKRLRSCCAQGLHRAGQQAR